MGSKGLPFHLVADAFVGGTVHGEDGSLSFTFEGDTQDNDFSGAYRSEWVPELNFDLIILGRKTYARAPGGDWIRGPRLRQPQPFNPFAELTEADLVYRRVRVSTGLHTLESNRIVGVDESRMPVENGTLELILFEIDVDDDGVPSEVRLEFAVVGDFEGDPATFSYHVDYFFTNVGLPVVIAAPI
jgi:hypothetical protein